MVTVTVANMPSVITGALTVCMDNATPLSSATTGATWSSSTPSVASISTTGIVTAASTGTTTVSYTNGSGCARSAVVTVNAAVPVNTGADVVCLGQATTLANTASGGSWISSVPGNATVHISTGLVTGVSMGTSNISYIVSPGCYNITHVTVNNIPDAITGTASVCIGATTALSHPVSGGTWASSNTARATIDASGVVTGISFGSATITYTASPGCYRTVNLSVNAVPGAIGGSASIAAGTTTTLTNSISGGTWSSSDVSVGTIGATSGLAGGIAAGTATISYRLATGCYTTREVTVNATAGRPGASSPREITKAKISVYPNPTSGALTIEAPVKGSLTVFGLDGKQVAYYDLPAQVSSVSLPAQLVTGSYLCRFNGVDGCVETVRMVYQQ